MYIYTTFDELARHTIDEAETGLFRSVGIIDRPFAIFVEVQREGTYGVGSVRTDDRHDALLYSTRKDETTVIVGMFTDQVNTARRGIYGAGLTGKFVCKCSDKLLFIHMDWI